MLQTPHPAIELIFLISLVIINLMPLMAWLLLRSERDGPCKLSVMNRYHVKILTPFGLALALLCANALAQDDKPAGCLVAHFKGIGLRTNDDTQRARLAEEWLRKNINTCSKEQVAAIKSNSPDWLGTAHTHDVNMIIDASLEAMAKGNPKQIAGMYAALDNERKATTDNIGTASPTPMVKPSV
jgi:hypothetical protein